MSTMTWVTAILNVTAEALKPAKLADTINSTMSWALQQARANQEVKSRSGAYQTYPVYEDKKIVRWRGRQELQLESRDVDQLSETGRYAAKSLTDAVPAVFGITG